MANWRGGRQRDSILANAVEAVIGAVRGWRIQACAALVDNLPGSGRSLDVRTLKDAKTQLQELYCRQKTGFTHL